MDAAELLEVLTYLDERCTLADTKVELVQGHPDYLGPDVESPVFTWALVGRTLKLFSVTSREVKNDG